MAQAGWKWFCPKCGHVAYGEEAPEECPECGNIREHFHKTLD